PSAKKARLNEVALINTLDIDEGCFLPSELEHPASLKKEIRSRARAWRSRQFPVSIFLIVEARMRPAVVVLGAIGNGPSRKHCIAAVSGRPHERGKHDFLFL